MWNALTHTFFKAEQNTEHLWYGFWVRVGRGKERRSPFKTGKVRKMCHVRSRKAGESARESPTGDRYSSLEIHSKVIYLDSLLLFLTLSEFSIMEKPFRPPWIYQEGIELVDGTNQKMNFKKGKRRNWSESDNEVKISNLSFTLSQCLSLSLFGSVLCAFILLEFILKWEDKKTFPF